MNNRCVISEWYELGLDEGLIKESVDNPNKPLMLQNKLFQNQRVENDTRRIKRIN